MRRPRSGTGAVALLAVMGAAPVFARSTETAASDRVDNSWRDEIVVTAQRREERLRDVPISITAVNAERVESAGITDVVSLPALIPNFSVQVAVSGYTPSLRGVGSSQTGAAPNEEQPVATYIDGVYIAAPVGVSTMQFNNIERIEVLRGPQGTLFGRNATGGVVQIVTREPSQEFQGQLTAGYGNYDTISGKAYVTGGLGNGIAADIAVVYEDRNDGFGRNFTTGRETFLNENLGLRSSLLLTPTGRTKIRVTGDYTHSDYWGPEFQLVPGITGADGVSTNPGPFNGLGERPIRAQFENWGVAAHITQELGAVDLVSISAYRSLEGTVDWDQDMTSAPLVAAQFHPRLDTFSQELQLRSPSTGPLEWMLGLYYYWGKGGYDPTYIDNRSTTSGVQTTNSYSAFGQATYTLTDSTKVTAGLRYTIEDQSMDWYQVSPAGAVTYDDVSKQEFDALTWRLVLAHEFSPQVNGYLSYNRGVHSGGFVSGSPGTPGYDPEYLDAYEIGFKTDLFDRRLQFNIAAFYYDYRDMHVKSLLTGSSLTQNAASAELYGVDADLTFRASRNLSLFAGLGTVRSEFREFPAATAISPTGVRSAIDAKGNEAPGAAPFTGSLGANLELPLAGGTFFATSTLSYNSGFYVGPDNRLEVPDYALLSGTMGWRSENDRYEVRLWARNITDSTYYIWRIEQATVRDAQAQGPPRTYGIELTAKF